MKRAPDGGPRKGAMPWDMPNIGKMLEASAFIFGARPAVMMESEGGGSHGHRIPYTGLWDHVLEGAAHLLGTGLRKGDRVVVVSNNNDDRLIFDLAVMSAGGIIVPLHPASGADRVSKVLDLVRPFMLYVHDQGLEEGALIEKLREDGWGLEEKQTRRRGYRAFVVRGRVPPPARWPAMRMGKDDGEMNLPIVMDVVYDVAPSDPCMIMFTSGTGGKQKGVMLTHRNVLFQTGATNRFWTVGPDDIFLTHLPWHHSFGGILERFLALSHGSCMAIVPRGTSSMLAVLKAWRTVRPTIIFSVPTVHRAAAMAARVSKETERELFHPGLRFVHTAAAPLPPETAEYYLAHDVNVVVGWGLTETSPCCTLGWTKKGTPAGFVGRPIPGVHVSVDGSGEILVNGPNVMVGYFGDPVATRAVLGKDGVLRTGDLGEFDSYGNLVLRGRADAVVKLSNGEKVPTSLIESALVGASALIGHAFVIGGPAKDGGCGGDYVAALLFVQGGPRKGIEEKLRWAIRKVNGDISKDFERVRAFAVLEDLPPFGGDMVTLTGKLVRARVIERYGDVIDGIYASCSPKGKGPTKGKGKAEGKVIGKDDDVVVYRPG